MTCTIPLLKDKQVIVDNSLAGTWIHDPNDAMRIDMVFKVQRAGRDKLYRVTTAGSDGKPIRAIGRVGKIGTLKVVELKVDDAAHPGQGGYLGGSIDAQAATHVTVTGVDADWLSKYIADHPDELKADPPTKDNSVLMITPRRRRVSEISDATCA